MYYRARRVCFGIKTNMLLANPRVFVENIENMDLKIGGVGVNSH